MRSGVALRVRIQALLAAVAEGRITPSEASALAGLIEAQRRAYGSEPSIAPAANVNVQFVAPESARG